MASSNVATTGVPTTPAANGAVPLRREVRDLQKNFPDQWNLFLLGLVNFQQVDADDLLSYYQLAGIHGEPFIPWDDVNGVSNPTFGGYCTHSSILFLTWHRPYLALYEQALYAIIQQVATQFPAAIRGRYVAAAQTFRIPYWDWAAKGPGSAFPSSISSQQATIIDVDGATKQISNPLYSYQFPARASQGDLDDRWSVFPVTLRYPDSNDASAQSRDDRVSRVISNENASLRNNVSLILLSYKQFDAFSNNEWLRNGRAGTYGSLEDIHNEIHDKTGGNGHMSALEVSAFDPVFWLHHCNVDRLGAIWQAMNPNSYVTAKASEGNFFTAQGATEDANSGLKPFWDASGTKFWTSTRVKETTTFGYAYPETQKWSYPSTQAYQAAVRNMVVKEYGANALNNFFSNASANIAAAVTPSPALAAAFTKKAVAHPAPPSAQHPIQAPKAANPGPAEHPPPPASAEPAAKPKEVAAPAVAPLELPEQFAHLALDNTYTEWITNMRAVKHGLSQTFRVLVFLGEFNPDPKTWPLEHNLVGRFTVLGRAPNTECAKCKTDQENELVVTGTVPLTTALLGEIVAGRLASLKTEDVEPYLAKNLHWRVTMFNGEEKDRNEVPGLKVSVVSTNVRIGDDGVPVYSDVYTVHPAITDGKSAGHSPGDQI